MDSLDLSLISTPSSAATELGATILQTNFPQDGWYLAEIDLFPGSRVYGTPLRLTSFAVGEKVTVFQCFPNGGGAEYGFAKPTEYSYGVAQIPDGYYDSFLASYKFGMALAWLARKAKNTKVMFEPGTVVSIIRSRGIAVGLLVNMRYSLTNANLGVVASIADLSDFEIGDGVLVSNWPGAGRAVVGWWLTAKVAPSLQYYWTFQSGTKDSTSEVIGVLTFTKNNLFPTPDEPLQYYLIVAETPFGGSGPRHLNFIWDVPEGSKHLICFFAIPSLNGPPLTNYLFSKIIFNTAAEQVTRQDVYLYTVTDTAATVGGATWDLINEKISYAGETIPFPPGESSKQLISRTGASYPTGGTATWPGD